MEAVSFHLSTLSLSQHQGPSTAPCSSECLPWDRAQPHTEGGGLSLHSNETIVSVDYLFSK